MYQHRKRPYNKPAITVIPMDSPQYEELMQSLPQQEVNTNEPKSTDDSHKQEEDKYV